MTSNPDSSMALESAIAADLAHAATSPGADGFGAATDVPRQEHGWREAPAKPACEDCIKAAKRQWHGFLAGCRGCCARAAARSPQFREAQKAGVQTHAYRRLLQQFGLEHAQVLAAAQADKVSSCA